MLCTGMWLLVHIASLVDSSLPYLGTDLKHIENLQPAQIFRSANFKGSFYFLFYLKGFLYHCPQGPLIPCLWECHWNEASSQLGATISVIAVPAPTSNGWLARFEIAVSIPVHCLWKTKALLCDRQHWPSKITFISLSLARFICLKWQLYRQWPVWSSDEMSLN